MNKSFLTNTISLLLLVIGYYTQHTLLLYAGLFAFSGAITNALAIHMLFEKVPGLYGSGVIPNRFEAIKLSIKNLMMAQFFTTETIQKFMSSDQSQDDKADKAQFDLAPVIEKIDFDKAYDALVEVILNSQFGGMLAMFGGPEALVPLKQPFVEKMQQNMIEMSQEEAVQQAIAAQVSGDAVSDKLEQKIEQMIDQRLNELTPQMVKQMVQTMIKEHLGWLVVWGGVFGGLIGVLSACIAA
ncbi:MAG: DUF445 family protein [Vibrio sp.]